MTALDFPAPLVPAEVNLRGTPIPREAFAKAAAEQFGVDIETARRFANEAADRIEGKHRPKPAGRKSRGRL